MAYTINVDENILKKLSKYINLDKTMIQKIYYCIFFLHLSQRYHVLKKMWKISQKTFEVLKNQKFFFFEMIIVIVLIAIIISFAIPNFSKY